MGSGCISATVLARTCATLSLVEEDHPPLTGRMLKASQW